MKVKKLEFDKYGSCSFDLESISFGYSVKKSWYKENNKSFNAVFNVYVENSFLGMFNTKEEAKDKCQKHFEEFVNEFISETTEDI